MNSMLASTANSLLTTGRTTPRPKGVPMSRCQCYAGKRHESEDAISATSSVFASAPVGGGGKKAPTASEAAEVVGDAEARFASLGARAEFCRSHGIDYDRFRRCAPLVCALERALAAAAGPNVPDENVSHMFDFSSDVGAPELVIESIGDSSGGVRVRVRVAGVSNGDHDALDRAGRCPLCRHSGHRLRMCPHVPDELRPFA
jgi:hypothetical protein